MHRIGQADLVFVVPILVGAALVECAMIGATIVVLMTRKRHRGDADERIRRHASGVLFLVLWGSLMVWISLAAMGLRQLVGTMMR
jgi:hypothetical protein